MRFLSLASLVFGFDRFLSTLEGSNPRKRAFLAKSILEEEMGPYDGSET